MISEQVFQKVFKLLPDPCLLISAQEPFKIIAANTTYLQLLQKEESDVIDRSIREIFPEDPEQVNALTASSLFHSLETVSKSAATHKLTSLRLLSPSLDTRYFDAENVPVTGTKEEPGYILHYLHESTGTQMSWLIDNTEESFILLDRHLKIISFNRRFENLYRLYLGKMVKKGDNILDYADPDRKEFLLAMYKRVIAGSTEESVIEIPLPGEETRCFAIKYIPAKDEGKQISGVFITVRDITGERSSQLEILKSRNQYQSLLQAIDGIFWEADAETFEFVFISPQVKRILGYTPEEWLAEEAFWQNHIHPDDRQDAIDYCYAKTRLLENHHFEYRMITADGGIVWIRDMVTIIAGNGKTPILRGLMLDITKKKNLQKEARESQEALQKILDQSLDIICTIDADGNFIRVSSAAEKIWGYTPAELTGKPYMQFVFEEDHISTMEAAAGISAGNEVTNFENRYVCKNGSIVPIVWSARWHKHEQVMYCIARDATEKKKAENALVVSEKKYKNLFENNPSPMFIWDYETLKIVDVNLQAQVLYGFIKEEFLQMTIRDVIPEADRTLDGEEIRRMYGDVNRKLWELSKKNGSPMKVEVSSHLNVYNGKIASLIMLNDITEKLKAEESLRISNQRFSYVTKATFDAIWDWDIVNNTIYWGEGHRTIFGWTAQEKDAGLWAANIHPDDLERVKKGLSDAIEGDQANWVDEYRYQKADQTYANVIDKGHIIRNEEGKAVRMVGAMQDVTKQKKDELALEQSEARHRGIIASQTNYVIRTDLAGNYTYYNQKFIDDFGWLHKTDDLIGVNSMSSIMEYHHPHVKEVVEKCFGKTNTVFQAELDKPAKNGRVKTTLWDFICLTDPAGNPTEIQCMGIDISERKRAEKNALSILEEKNTILESIGDAFFAVDKNWIVTYWNSQAEKMLIRLKKNIVGRHLWEVFANEVNSESYKRYHQAVETKEVVHFQQYNAALLKWFEVSAYPSERGLSVYFKDITERKHAETHMRTLNENLQKHAKELAISNAELEQFAYVASHDLQEPLRMVTSFLTQLEKKYGSEIDEKGKRYIHFAVDGAKRMRQIILELLEFSRVGRTEDKKVDVDLNELIEEIRLDYRKQLQEKQAILDVDMLPVVHAPKSLLRQVFQNLIDNALKYQNKGVQPLVRIRFDASATHWYFSVTDNGLGIDPEYFEKIFIIFQRLHNKEEYSGTGMGLAVTKKVVENLGGRIWVESEEGKGSTFKFTIRK